MAIRPGEFIKITKRKCGDKVQPYLKEGGIYCVESIDELKDGTKVLVLFRGLDKLCRCNAKRFSWKIYKEEHLAKRMADFRVEMFEKRINASCTDDENATISFRPVMLMFFMWRYADIVLKYCGKNKISKYKVAARELREIREKTYSYIEKNIGLMDARKIENHVEEFIKENKVHFTALRNSVRNMFLIRDYWMEHIELYTDVFIAILMCRELYTYEMKAEEILTEKKIYHSKEYHLLYRKEFFLCISKFIEGVNYGISPDVKRCMEIFENDFNRIEFVNSDK